ncbi:amidohydrolase family protein [Rhizobium sp. 007]|uniref:amidohydrolase family protein n=1 Tax=Rhizobium sp. 007 TaxID=2785056 RepID=UPI001FEFA619|nr:amidohydrolase family protein [Rhizobium sp. 007]
MDRLIFGTDWLMLGQEKGYEHNVDRGKAFLSNDCSFTEEICDKIFRRNALDFLPLQQPQHRKGTA